MRDKLRDYQVEAVNALISAMESKGHSALYTLPTGTGKTTVIAELVRLARELYDYRILVLAHRQELIEQICSRIKSYCELDDLQIGVELADRHASIQHKIVVGSVQTCMNVERLAGRFDLVITDEAHHCSAPSYLKIYKHIGVGKTCFHIGCTATAKRGDNKSLYTIDADGKPMILKGQGAEREATLKDSVFERLVYEYPIADAIGDGYLVPFAGHVIRSETNLDGVGITQGDFAQGALAKEVDNEKRTRAAITAVQRIDPQGRIIVFCAGVEHAYHTAEMFEDAGFVAAALDGTVEKEDRLETLNKFKSGEIQVLCNMSLYTEGVDIAAITSVVILRPTKIWNLYCQMVGRGTRPIVSLAGLESPGERRKAIEASSKPLCHILDVVDISRKHNVCTAPSILNLPSDIDLEGHTVTEVKELLERIDDDNAALDAEIKKAPPKTFKELSIIVERIDLLHQAGRKQKRGWIATDTGYRFQAIPPGYSVTLDERGDQWHLAVEHKGIRISGKVYTGDGDTKALLEYVGQEATNIVGAHRVRYTEDTRNSLKDLTPAQVNVLRRDPQKRTMEEFDKMPIGYLKKCVAEIVQNTLSYPQRNVLLKAGYRLHQIEAMPIPEAKRIIDKLLGNSQGVRR